MKDFKSLKDTTLYSVAGDVENTFKEIMAKGSGTIRVTEEMLDLTLNEIKKRSFKSDAKYAVLDAISKGKIIIVYNDKKITPLGMPFIKTSSGLAIVNITKIANMDEDGTVTSLDAKLFYGICFTALLYAKGDMPIVAETSTLINMYASMVLQTLNTVSIIEKSKKDVVKYLAAKFYILAHYDKEGRMKNDEDISRKCLAIINNPNTVYINEVDAKFQLDWYDNLETFLYGISQVFAKEFGAGIPTKKFIDIWFSSFGQITGFAMEYPPYLIMILALIYFKGVSRIDFIRHDRIQSSIDRNASRLMTRLTDMIRK